MGGRGWGRPGGPLGPVCALGGLQRTAVPPVDTRGQQASSFGAPAAKERRGGGRSPARAPLTWRTVPLASAPLAGPSWGGGPGGGTGQTPLAPRARSAQPRAQGRAGFHLLTPVLISCFARLGNSPGGSWGNVKKEWTGEGTGGEGGGASCTPP